MSFIESIKNILDKTVADCFAGSDAAFQCQVTPCQDKQFGDYQSNLAFLLAKRERTSPRRIADAVAGAVRAELGLSVEQDGAGDSATGPLSAGALIETIEVAGQGFINIRIRNSALVAELERTLTDPRCGVERVSQPQRIVVDYSSPNLAKELHVGTMRSTVIGDSIARVLEFLGHEVLRQNHFGDWGGNFGVLVAMIKQEYGAAGLDELRAAPLEEVEELYARGSKLKKDSDDFAARAATEVNNLQSGNAEVPGSLGGPDGEDLASVPRVIQDVQRQSGRVP